MKQLDNNPAVGEAVDLPHRPRFLGREEGGLDQDCRRKCS